MKSREWEGRLLHSVCAWNIPELGLPRPKSSLQLTFVYLHIGSVFVYVLILNYELLFLRLTEGTYRCMFDAGNTKAYRGRAYFPIRSRHYHYFSIYLSVTELCPGNRT